MSHRAALAALRAARAGGVKSRLESYQIEEKASIYDEVDEEGYKKVVRSRLNQDDFVVDDNGEGYADDGREEWQNERQYYSSEEEDRPLRGKAAKRKREEDQEKEERTNHKIMNYFNSGANTTTVKPRVSRITVAECSTTELMFLGPNHSRGRSFHGRHLGNARRECCLCPFIQPESCQIRVASESPCSFSSSNTQKRCQNQGRLQSVSEHCGG